MLWRRSLRRAAAPAGRRTTSTSQVDDPRYAGLPDRGAPRTECLADVVRRVDCPTGSEMIVPDLRAVAQWGGAVLRRRPRQLHPGPAQTSSRAFSDSDIPEVEVPTGIPYRMLLDESGSVHSARLPRRPSCRGGRGCGRGPAGRPSGHLSRLPHPAPTAPRPNVPPTAPAVTRRP